MAYIEQYYTIWNDSEGKEHEMKLLQDGGSSGTTSLEIQDSMPYEYFFRGSKESQIEDQVFGREILFSFIIPSSQISIINNMVRSNYKEWKIEHYLSSTLDGVFWLQPDNFSRNYIKNGNYYEITLSGVDGLGNIKGIEYTDASDKSQYEDRVRIIRTIKRVLEHVGIELDFRVQLGTWCTNDSLMTSSECALDKVDSDSRRFTKEKDGRLTNTDCYTVISELLEPMSCYLIQSQGYYYIINTREDDSYYFPIAWSDLTVSARVSSDLKVVIDNYNFTTLGEAQTIRPIESIGVTFRNRNIKDNALSNGDFHLPNTDEWVESADINSFTTQPYGDDYELQATVDVAANGVPAATPNFHSVAQSIVVRGETDQIQVTFNVRCFNVIMDAAFSGPDYYKYFKVGCRIRKGTASGDIIASSQLDITIGAPDTEQRSYIYYFDISENDDYFIEFLINTLTDATVWSDYDLIDVRFDNIFVAAAYSTGEDITFDSYKKVSNADSNYVDFKDINLKFADSANETDIGAFKINGTLTETWNRYSKTENQSISKLCGQNILENFAQYKDYLHLSIHDETDSISPHSIIQIGSKKYQQVSQQVSYPIKLQKIIDVELVEILNTAVSISVLDVGLSSIDGDKEASSPPSGAISSSTGNPSQKGWEPVIDPKNTAFNQNYGTTANTVAYGDHNHNGVYSPVITGGASTIVTDDLTINRALISNGSGKVAVSAVTSTELGYVSGVTSAIQTQINGKEPSLGNPGTNGYILSSTTGGARSWVSNEASQWTTSGSDIYYNTGNVGIGTTNPYHKLDVIGQISAHNEVNFSPSVNARATGYLNYSGYAAGLTQFRDLWIGDGKSNNIAFFDGENQSFGLGTITPTAKLEVKDSSYGGSDVLFRISADDDNPYGLVVGNNTISATANEGLRMWVLDSGTALINAYSAGSYRDISFNGGNVGIGTTSPNEKLEVNGNILSTSNVIEINSAGSAYLIADRGASLSNDAYSWYKTGGVSKWLAGIGISGGEASSDDYRITDGSNTRFLIERTTGNVGIGTTSPDGTLHVHTATAGIVTAASGADDLVIENSGAAGMSILSPNASDSTINFGSPSDVNHGVITSNFNTKLMRVGTAASSMELAFVTGVAAEAMRIDDNGNVGIGTTTPDANLQVVQNLGAIGILVGGNVSGSAGISNNVRKFTRIGMPHYTSDTEEPLALIIGDSDGTDNIITLGSGSNSFNVATEIRFSTAPTDTTQGDATGIATRMTISGGGNVGIGTTSPGVKLDVALETAGTIARFTGTSSAGLTIQEGTFGGVALSAKIAHTSSNRNIEFETAGSGSFLFSNGNVGIGTTSPQTELHVYRNTDHAHLARFEGASSEYVDLYDYGVVINRSQGLIINNFANGELTLRTNNGTGERNRISIAGGNDSITFSTHNGQSMFEMYTTSGDPYLQFKDSAGAGSTKLWEDPTAVGGTYGSLAIDGGATGGYEGFSIGGRVVFMHDNGTTTGIFDDVNNHWMFQGTLGAGNRLYYADSNKLETTNTGATCTGILNATTNLQEGGTNLSSIYEPIISPKNSAFNKNFAGSGAASTISRSDHNHSGVYEPIITPKNTAFNKNFAGSGAAITVSRSDHTHGGLAMKVVDIGDWNMVSSINLNVAHGLTLSTIRVVHVMIRNDSASLHIPLFGVAGTDRQDGLLGINATYVQLTRETGGYFDTGVYSTTSYNRGWITLWYDV